MKLLVSPSPTLTSFNCQHQCCLRKMILKNCFAENFASAGSFVLSERRNIVTCFPGHLLCNTCSSSAVEFKLKPSFMDRHFRLASCSVGDIVCLNHRTDKSKELSYQRGTFGQALPKNCLQAPLVNKTHQLQ